MWSWRSRHGLGHLPRAFTLRDDVILSLPEPRQAAYRELGAWLDWYTAHVDPAATTLGSGAPPRGGPS